MYVCCMHPDRTAPAQPDSPEEAVLLMVMAIGKGLEADQENVKRLIESFQIIERPDVAG